MQLSASDRLVGDATLLLAVRDKDGKPVAAPGALKLRADMNHAGMIPSFAASDKAVDGVFSLPFAWTMAGSWIVEARLTLPNGDSATEIFNFEILPEAGAGLAGMDHGGMPGEKSAVYMRISNRGDSDRVIVSAESEAAKQIEFHRTLVEDDVARMEALETLVIPAGEMLELRPGGAHIMLSGLTADLLPEGEFALRLKCDAGEVYSLDISIADRGMSDLDDKVEFGDLVFSNRWTRPAKSSDLPQADGHSM